MTRYLRHTGNGTIFSFSDTEHERQSLGRYLETGDYTEVVMIDGPLPEVTHFGGQRHVESQAVREGSNSPEWHDMLARRHAALARDLRANPPIDEAAVKQAKIALVDTGRYDSETARDVARDLVRKGYRIEATS